MKVCPRLRAANIASAISRHEWENDVCLGNVCELWNDYFDCCSSAVGAQLKGEAERDRARRQEAKSERDRSEL